MRPPERDLLDARGESGERPLSGEAGESPVVVDSAQQERSLRWIVLAALLVFSFLFLSYKSESLKALWRRHPGAAGLYGNLPAQEQAQAELDDALLGRPGAVEALEQSVSGWRGKLQPTSPLLRSLHAAIHHPDLRLRAAAIELTLAAYDLAKTSQQVERLIREAEPGNAGRIPALWALGMLGNRGVEADRVRETLLSHLHDPGTEARKWSVEGLGLFGADDAIEPLLEALHNDPAPAVRSRAAQNLAQAGMFDHQQRMSAVPALIEYLSDPALDRASHALTYQALRAITGQQLPDQPAAWRSWYTGAGGRP